MKTVCGVGIKGNILTTEPNGSRKPYSVWKNMIHRCYNPTNERYDYYGGRGVRVSDRWLTYENFRNDIEKLKGYDEELFYRNKIELDKDSIDRDAKLYSKETCVWLSPAENNALTERVYESITTVKAVALDPEDREYCIINIPWFAKSVGINKSEIYGVLSEKGNKTARGWCFKRVENTSKVVKIDREDYTQKSYGPAATKYKVEFGTEEKVFPHVDKASEFLGCSSSLLTQRTRQLGEYIYKEKYKVSRIDLF